MKFKTSDEMYEYWINQPLKMKTRVAWMNIKATCDQMEKEGVGITVYSVGNRLKINKISPKTQSLWNNENFQNYINMRKEEGEKKPKNLKLNDINGDEKLLEIIYELRKENECLRKLISQYSIF